MAPEQPRHSRDWPGVTQAFLKRCLRNRALRTLGNRDYGRTKRRDLPHRTVHIVSGTFATWQPEYAARGLATFPLRSDDRKRPAVGNYNRMGLRASAQLVMKWGSAEGLACMAGPRNKITVVDVDARGAEGERLLADVQSEVGASRFIVKTGGGGFHAYYRHNGEQRKIRFDPRRPIDLLGGGQVVLPPSLGSKSSYELIQGTLDDLTTLTTIRGVASPPSTPLSREEAPHPFAFMQAHSGRNNALFRELCKEARALPLKLDAFVNRARELNGLFQVAMTDARVVNTAKSVFRYAETGELRTGQQGSWLSKGQVQQLVEDPYLLALVAWLKSHNRPEAEFWIANGMAKHLRWSERQLREVRRRAIGAEWIEMIVAPAKGRNAVYRWGPAARPLGCQK
jgi:hypothetical protein